MRSPLNVVSENRSRRAGRADSKAIILGGFAIVILLGLLPILYSEWAVERSARTMNQFVDVDEKIADLSLTSTTKMIKARRNEKDFLLSYRDFGFDEAKARYITTVLSIIADIKENMNRIRLLANDPEIIRLSREIDQAITRYETGLVSFVELHGTLGNKNTGLEGKIGSAAREMEDLLRQGENKQLIADLFSLRMSEKDYFLDDLDMNFAKIQSSAERLRTDIGAGGRPPEHAKKLLQRLDGYMALVRQYAQIEEQLTTTRQTYLKDIQNVEPMLEKLHSLSLNNAYKSNSGIKQLEKNIKRTIFIIFFLVSFLSSAMAFFVLRRIGEAEERLTISERKYRTLFETSPDSITIMDLNHTILMVNQRTLRLLGYDHPQDMVGKNGIPMISPEDRRIAVQLLTDLLTSPTTETVESKMMRNDGGSVYVEWTASLIPDAHGEPESVIVVARDITARKRAEEEARTAQEYARYIVNSSLDMIVTVDTDRRIVEFNKAAEDVLGYRKDEILGQHVETLYCDAEENSRVRKAMLETGRFVGEISNKKKNHEVVPVLLSASVIRDADGRPTGFMGILRDITERKKIEEELKAAATLDKLTGIYNRRMFESILDGELVRAERYKSPLSLIMIDVDHFKKVNDTYGHQVGDTVLQTLAVIVKDNIRKSDVFGRWGGEEFMVLAPETAGEETLELAEKIRRLIEKHTFEKAGKVTISCGIAQFRERDTVDSILKRTDDGLYQAKHQGRNRVVMEQ